MTRVLIVEDSRTQAEALQLILETAGFAVDAAPDAEQALETLSRAQFDVVISDVLMPGLSGYELCRRIKDDRRRSQIPVVLLTTLSEPRNIIEGLESGADSFLTKPYDPEHLVNRIHSIVDNRRLRAEGRLKLGAEVLFLGRKITVTSDRQQILDLLISTLEDVVATNRELQGSQAALAAANAKLEEYAQKLEAKVRLSEEKYRNLMEHAHDGVLVVDCAGVVLEVNREAERVFGRSASDVVGRRYQDLIAADERAYVEAHFEKVLVEKAARTNDVHLDRPDGAVVCADLSASLVESGSEPVILVLVRDVTERNRVQRQAIEQDKLAVIGTLAAGVAHEVNNPASVVVGNLQVLEEDLNSMLTSLTGLRAAVAGLSAPEVEPLEQFLSELDAERIRQRQHEIISDCIHAARHIMEIVRDLTSFARIDEDDMDVVDVNERIEMALRMALPGIRHHITVERSYADVPKITAHPRRLEQLFLNLIVNAAHAMEGEVGEHRLTISTRREGGAIRIDIADTGKGIEQKILDRIFDPFFTTKPAGIGTGLGLSICRDIVIRHGGHLEVNSEVGRGTTFSICVPVNLTAVTPEALRSPVTPVRGCALLLVDDDASLLATYQRVLELRHDVTTANGGRAALALLSGGAPFDVILCDMMMPDVDGIDIHRYLRERNPELADRMVFLSGGVFTARADQFLAQVTNPRLTKPATVAEIERVISEVIAGR